MSDAARRFHETWLGMVQPSEGLVVTIPALIEADCFERQSADDHRAFLEFLEEAPKESATAGDGPAALRIRDVLDFLVEGLGWNDALLEREPPEDLSLYVPEGGQTIAPTAALRYPDYAKSTEVAGQSLPPAAREGQAFRILVWELPDGLPFHEPETVTGSWEYPPEKKFERLLRECRVPVGLLTNRRVIRLLYAPLGEASGYIDFRVQDMAEVGGRPIFDALVMLLSAERIEGVAPDRQLEAILKRSREMQAEVTTALSSQVFTALEVLLQGFEAADLRQGGALLRPVMEQERDILYEGLLTVLLRLVFLLYAEDSGLLPTEHPLFSKHYSLYALFERLEQERGQYPDAMNRRYSAWPQLLALFRSVFLGVDHGDLHLPPREGHLFDPHRFPFLEGFEGNVVPIRDAEERAQSQVPTVDDETIYQVLRNLVYLGNERLSYRNLYEEQIGSVYEALMGYYTMRVESPSVRIKPSDSKVAPTWLSAEELLRVKPAQRSKWLKETAGLAGARSQDAPARSVVDRKGSRGKLRGARPRRRRSDSKTSASKAARWLAREGSSSSPAPSESGRAPTTRHPPSPRRSSRARSNPCSPRSAPNHRPTQILSLTVCDPAMGSGAFLVEACRYLGERLLEAWVREGRADRASGQGRRCPHLCAPSRRRTLPLRRRQEPVRRGAGEALSLARHPPTREAVYVPGPQPSLRRLAGRLLLRADHGVSLEAWQADGPLRGRAPGCSRRSHSRARRHPGAKPRRHARGQPGNAHGHGRRRRRAVPASDHRRPAHRRVLLGEQGESARKRTHTSPRPRAEMARRRCERCAEVESLASGDPDMRSDPFTG